MENMAQINKFHKNKMPCIFTTSQLNKLGIKNYEITRLCKKGVFIRIKQGYFCYNDELPSDEEIISVIYMDGIICRDSALFFYNYSDRTPQEWTLAFSRDVTRSRFYIDYLDIKPVFVQKDMLELGKTQVEINGQLLNIYDRERVICDCFKFRNRMDSEQFNKAVTSYVKDEKKNLYNLISYAKQMHIYEKVMELIGVILNER